MSETKPDAIPPDMISLGAKLAQLAARHGGRPAITCGGDSFTFAELHRLSNRLARALAAKGVKYGDLVTIGLPNSVGFAAAAYATWKLGATPQPVSFRLPKAELAAIIELARSPLVIADFDHQLDVPVLRIADLEALSDDDSDLPDVTAPILKAPTSGGSTGRPKLILAGTPAVAPRETPAEGGYQLKRDGVVLIPGPLYHNAPFGLMTSATSMGCHTVITPRFDAEGTLAAVDRYRPDWLYLVPTMMTRIWRLPEEVKAKYDLSSVEKVWHMAAPCPPWLKEAFIHWFAPHGEVMELYAGTEAQAITIISGTEWLAHKGSVGRVVVGEMKVFGEDGAELPAGEVGEIYMRRTEGTPETYRYLGASAKVLPGGWESLGDMGRFDEDGYLYLADRRTDMILVGGSNVYPAEIESALQEHPAVESCAVIGLPDEEMGARVHAIVKAKGGAGGGALVDELKAHLKDRLVTYKQPRTYEFVDEPVRDDAGKVRRTALRQARLTAGA